jgi:hypothetical protein
MSGDINGVAAAFFLGAALQRGNAGYGYTK